MIIPDPSRWEVPRRPVRYAGTGTTTATCTAARQGTALKIKELESVAWLLDHRPRTDGKKDQPSPAARVPTRRRRATVG